MRGCRDHIVLHLDRGLDTDAAVPRTHPAFSLELVPSQELSAYG